MRIANNLLAALSLASYFGTALGQYRPGNWTYDIPAEEEAALASIVEDLPVRVNLTVAARALEEESVQLVKRKDNLSPLYPLIYRNPLPIPPVKEPFM